jgi:phosphohistidine phosphatase SixA
MPQNRARAVARYALLAVGLLLAPAAQAGDEETWALLKQPGHIALLRHSNAPGGWLEPYGMDLKDCAIQRNLDVEGRAQARRLGAELRKHGLANVRIVSSQFCRALETGKLLGVGPVGELAALNQIYAADVDKLTAATAQVKAYLHNIPRNQPAVLVSHVTNIFDILGVNLSSGEVAVVHLDAAGALVLDGRVMVK